MQQGLNRISYKLDRVMATKVYLDMFANSSISDHSPSIFHFGQRDKQKEPRFPFFNYWTKHNSMFEVVADTWESTVVQGSLMYTTIECSWAAQTSLQEFGWYLECYTGRSYYMCKKRNAINLSSNIWVRRNQLSSKSQETSVLLQPYEDLTAS